MPNVNSSSEAPRPVGLGTIVLFFFGLYLLAGAYVAMRDGKWPIFMPPQLDLIGLLLSAPSGGAGHRRSVQTTGTLPTRRWLRTQGSSAIGRCGSVLILEETLR